MMTLLLWLFLLMMTMTTIQYLFNS